MPAREARSLFATRRLEAFLAVLESGGVNRAAQRLGVSQPTVSGLIRALERSIGAELLVRGSRVARPTPAGRALAVHAARLLAVADEAAEAVNRADRSARRRLAVAAGEALATHVLPEAVARLRRRLPGLEALFVVGDEARVLDALRSGEVDAALMTDRTRADDLSACDIGPGRLVLVTAADHRFACRRRVRLSDLASETLVVRDAGTVNRRQLEAMLAAAAVEPRARLIASSLEAVKRCVEAGLGVTIVPSIAVERECHDGRLVAAALAAEGLGYRFVFCTRRGEPATAPIRALLQVLRTAPSIVEATAGCGGIDPG